MERLESASAGFAHTGYRFGEFRLSADGDLLHGETKVHLSPKELAVLRLLLTNSGRIVTTQELKQALGGDVPALAESVSKWLASLRKKLEPEECIEAVYKRGYRISAPVQALDEPAGLPQRLAILPFAVEYGVPEYLGTAIAQETGARIENWRIGTARPTLVSVVPRESVFTLAQRGFAPQQIAGMLKADLILKGSLRALPSHFRMQAEMIHAADGSQAWVEDLLVDRSRIGGLETELVNVVNLRMNAGQPATPKPASVPVAIAASAAPVDEEQQLERATRRREAYELFQRGRFEWQSLERHRMQDALQHLLRAVELDPDLVAARVELVHLTVAQEYFGFMPPQVAADLVGRMVSSLNEIPDGAEGILSALAWISFHVDRNLPSALSSFRRGDHLHYDSWIVRTRTLLSLSRHRFDEAIERLESAIDADPWCAWPQARIAWAHHLAGHAAASVELARTALERFPLHEGAQFYGAIILAFNGQPAQAAELAAGLSRQLPYFDLPVGAHAYALAMGGHPEEAHALLERLDWLSRERYVLKTFSPAVYVALGEPEKALAGLRAAADTRCPWFFQMLADPRLKPLHGHPEFESLRGILAAMEAEAERDVLEE